MLQLDVPPKTRTRRRKADSQAALEHKRQLHRVLVKKAYYQQAVRANSCASQLPSHSFVSLLRMQNTLNALRLEQQELESRYQWILAQQQTQIDSQVARGDVVNDDKLLMVQLMRIKHEIVQENKRLRELHDEYLKFQLTLQQSSKALVDAAAARAARSENNRSPYVTITPLTLEEQCEVTRLVYIAVQDFRQSRDHYTLNAKVLGWKHRYRFADDKARHLQYSLTKQFSHLSAYELALRSWDIITTTKSYQALHSASLKSEMHFIQRIDDDNFVFFRVLQREKLDSVFFTLLLASRFETEKGWMTIYRSIKHDRITSRAIPNREYPDKEVEWLEMFSWTSFETEDDDSVRFDFGGEMRHSSTANAKFWLLETLMMAVRWETMAVAPLFKLT